MVIFREEHPAWDRQRDSEAERISQAARDSQRCTPESIGPLTRDGIAKVDCWLGALLALWRMFWRNTKPAEFHSPTYPTQPVGLIRDTARPISVRKAVKNLFEIQEARVK